MAFSRERIFFEREFQERVLVFNSAFRHLPNGGLDQVDPMLGSGYCFVAPPQSITQHVMEFYILLQSILWM